MKADDGDRVSDHDREAFCFACADILTLRTHCEQGYDKLAIWHDSIWSTSGVEYRVRTLIRDSDKHLELIILIDGISVPFFRNSFVQPSEKALSQQQIRDHLAFISLFTNRQSDLWKDFVSNIIEVACAADVNAPRDAKKRRK